MGSIVDCSRRRQMEQKAEVSEQRSLFMLSQVECSVSEAQEEAPSSEPGSVNEFEGVDVSDVYMEPKDLSDCTLRVWSSCKKKCTIIHAHRFPLIQYSRLCRDTFIGNVTVVDFTSDFIQSFVFCVRRLYEPFATDHMSSCPSISICLSTFRMLECDKHIAQLKLFCEEDPGLLKDVAVCEQVSIASQLSSDKLMREITFTLLETKGAHQLMETDNVVAAACAPHLLRMVRRLGNTLNMDKHTVRMLLC